MAADACARHAVLTSAANKGAAGIFVEVSSVKQIANVHCFQGSCLGSGRYPGGMSSGEEL